MPIPETLSTDPYAILDPGERWRPDGDAQLHLWQMMPPLVEKVRLAVKEWRDAGYPDISDTTRALLSWWFERNEGDGKGIHYYFSQREAVESVIYLYEAKQVRDKHDLTRFSSGGIDPEKMMAETWRRFVVKMATGSGKTKVVSLLIAWSYFHKLYEADSQLSRNILLIAPNIIVLDRLYRDFENLNIFYEDRVLPPNGHEGRDWENDFQVQLHRQNEVRSRSENGNIFLTNIHRVYVRDTKEPSPDDDDTRDYFLGPKPTDPTENRIDLGEVVRELDELLIINDEAHHIHDDRMAWFKTIQDIHNTLVQKQKALSLQVDMTATPKRQDGSIFVQTVSDYPLVEAIYQNVVKRPVIPDDESSGKLEEQQSSDYGERHADYIELGVKEWRKARDAHEKAGKKAVLFLMTDDTKNCDALGEYLEARFHDLTKKVLIIHTKQNGEITETSTSGKKEKELTELRKQAATIDSLDNPYSAVVSVLVLREGWDVRNVTTVVGLRAYSAKSNILPEQTLGRGLRLMYPDRNDSGEKVSIIGSPAFVDFVKEIEKEGVKLERVSMGAGSRAQAPTVVAIDRENPDKNIDELEISVPVLSRQLSMDFSKIEELKAEDIQCPTQEYKEYPADAPREIVFIDVLMNKVSHVTKLGDNRVDDYSRVIGYFAGRIMEKHNLFSHYDFFYKIVKEFVRDHLFGKTIDLEDENTVRNLAEPPVTKAILDSFAQAITELLTKHSLQVEILGEVKVTDMRPFPMKSPKFVHKPVKSPQNLIAENFSLEYEFAKFLDTCPDVVSFAKNYFAVNFHLDYVKSSGEITRYFPDFLVRNDKGEVWVVEMKGRKDIDDVRKQNRLKQWCDDVRKLTSDYVVGSLFIEESEYNKNPVKTFADLITMFENKGAKS